MKIFSATVAKHSLLLFLLVLSFSVQAIVIRHDKADSRYRVDEAQYPQIFYLHKLGNKKVCVATLISPQWAITAAHCADQTPLKEAMSRSESFPLSIAGRPFKVTSLVVHPNYLHADQKQAVDLALIKLDRVVRDVAPARLYLKKDEQNQIVSIMGWGNTGIGTLGRQGNDGKLRKAQNLIVKAEQWLEFEFDDPRAQDSTALFLEGVPSLHDSGGPALIEGQEGIQLLGVALGEVDDELNPGQQGRYGATEIYERVSSHIEWIETTILENLYQ